MNPKKQEIAFSNRYLYYYASLVKKLYGFIIRRGDDQPDERFVGHLGEPPERKELPSDIAQHVLHAGRDGLPEIGEIVLFRFRKRLLLGVCREVLTRRVSEIAVQTEDERHIHFHKTNLVYLSGITQQNDIQELYQYAQTVRDLSAHIDLKTIWELAGEHDTTLTLEDIADLYWNTDQLDATQHVSLYLYLNQSCPYFTPVTDGYVPTSRDEMKQRFQTQNSRQQRADEREEFIAYLQDETDLGTASLTKHQQKWFEAIQQYALWGQEAKHARDARAILSEVGAKTKNYKRLAFDCMVAKGIWHPDEILDLHRSEIPTQFSKAEKKHAAACLHSPIPKGRKHVNRGLFVVRDNHLPELALSYRKPLFFGPEFCIHVPDLSALIPQNSLTDHTAAERLQTIYLPDHALPLLPETPSFSADKPIPTLSLIWQMDRKGRLKSFQITPSQATIQAELTANEIDRAHHNDAHLYHRAITFFNQLSNRLKERRHQAFLEFDVPDLHLTIQNDTPQIDPLPNQMAHHIIHELSILAGVAIGRWCHEHQLPAIYETRDEPEGLEDLTQIENPIVRRHEIRRLTPNLKKTEHPSKHHAWDVAIFCPITDPNNHYDHLIMQRQINHYLSHQTALYDEDVLNALRYQIQDMNAIADGIIFRRQRDVLLQLWENQIGTEFDATVLHLKRHGVLVELKNAPFKTIVYPHHQVAIGDTITLRLTGINTDQAQAHFTVLQPHTISQN